MDEPRIRALIDELDALLLSSEGAGRTHVATSRRRNLVEITANRVGYLHLGAGLLRAAFAPAEEVDHEDEGPVPIHVEPSSPIDGDDEREMLYFTRFAGSALVEGPTSAGLVGDAGGGVLAKLGAWLGGSAGVALALVVFAAFVFVIVLAALAAFKVFVGLI